MDTVLVIGDTHCPGMHEHYIDHLVKVKREYKPTKIVHIGDLVDWHAISFHAKVQGTLDAQQEIVEAKKQIKALTRAFPDVIWLMGNHDALPQRKAADANLPFGLLKSEREFWELPKGWKVLPRYSRHEIDKVIYSHGETGKTSSHAAYQQAKDSFQSTVIGHLHAQFEIGWAANHSNLVFGMSVGCGVDWELLQFEYGKKFTTKPILGCGVVIEGKYPYLEPMVL